MKEYTDKLDAKRIACNQAYLFSADSEQRFARELRETNTNGEYTIRTSVLPALLFLHQIRCEQIEYAMARRDKDAMVAVLFYLLEQLKPTPPVEYELYPDF